MTSYCQTCGAIEVDGACYSHECPSNHELESMKSDLLEGKMAHSPRVLSDGEVAELEAFLRLLYDL